MFVLICTTVGMMHLQSTKWLGLGVSAGFSLHWWHVFLSEGSQCCWVGVQWCLCTLSSLEQTVPISQSPGSPYRRANSICSCGPDFYQVPAFTLCQAIYACQPALFFLCFISGVCLCFRTPNFMDLAQCGPAMALWSVGGSWHTVA